MEEQVQDVSGYHPGAIAAGVVLLGLGAAIFLARTGAIDIHPGRLIGPLSLITLGASKAFGPAINRRGRRRSSTSGIWFIGVGVWMLVAQNGFFGLTFHNSWPLLLLLGGVLMVIRGLK